MNYWLTHISLLALIIEIKPDTSIKCHNQVPKNSPKPVTDIKELNRFPEEKAGISPKINLTSATALQNIQIQSAFSLVPCDQEVISIFIPSTVRKKHFNPHNEFSVAAIFTDEMTKRKLNLWAHQKFHQRTSNPIKSSMQEHLRLTPRLQVNREQMMDILCPKEQIVKEERKDDLRSKASDNPTPIHELVTLIERLKAIATNLESNKEDSNKELSLSIEKRSFQHSDDHSSWILLSSFINRLAISVFSNHQDIDRKGRTCHDGLLFGRCFVRRLVNFILPKRRPPKPVYHVNQKPQEQYHTTVRPLLYNVRTEYNRFNHYEQTTKKYIEKIKETTVQPNTLANQESNTLSHETTNYKVVTTDAIKDPDWVEKDTSASEPIWVHGNSFPRNILRQQKATSIENTPTTLAKEYLNINQQPLEPTSLVSEFPHTSQYLSDPFLFISSNPESSYQPKVKFKLRIRTRQDFSCCQPNKEGNLGTCSEITEECQNLIRKGKYVNCKNLNKKTFNKYNFSERSSWLDCYEEDNEYLKNLQLYNTCPDYPSDPVKLKDNTSKQDHRKCYDEECFFRDLRKIVEKEKREKRKLKTHVFKSLNSNAGDYSRPLYPETSDFSSTHPQRPNGYEPIQPSFDFASSSYPNILHRRNSFPRFRKHFIKSRLLNVKSDEQNDYLEDVLTYQSQNCRVLIFDKTNIIRRRCDKIIETQSINYNQAISLFPPDDQSHKTKFFVKAM